MNNYYEILGVSHNATLDEIKSKYREFALKFHPDKVQTSLSEDMMKKLNEAYDILSDFEKRKQYDQNFDSSETKSSQKENNFKKSARSIWWSQLKTIAKELQKILRQFNESQRSQNDYRNNKKSKTYRKSYGRCKQKYRKKSHRESNYCDCDCHEFESSQEDYSEQDSFEDTWSESLRKDAEFVEDMFGFKQKSKNQKKSEDF